MKKNLYFTSLGCSRNQVDSEVMIAKLFDAGFVLSNKIDKSDVFVVNTCGFLKEARDEAYAILDEIFDLKTKNAKVIIAGCMANAFSKELKERYSDVYSILSSGNIDKIIETLNKSSILVDKLSYVSDEAFSRVLINYPHLAYLKISEGCSKACSFCIMPKIKGPIISRSIDSIVEEFKVLLKSGVFEVNLTAQDLLDYAKDRSEKKGFINLLKQILKIKSDFWLRFLYIYPDEMTDEFIDLITSDERICKYLDIPLQHVGDRILKKMKRKTSKKKIYDLFEKLRKKMPDLSIRTSLMVGFPSENESDFNQLEKFINDFQIDHLAIFKYSNEKLAYSYNFTDQISEEIKQERFERLSEMQFKRVQKKNKKMIGKKLQVLIDSYHQSSDLLINSRSYAQAFSVDSNIIINDIEKVRSFGSLQTVEISDLSGYDLIAKPL